MCIPYGVFWNASNRGHSTRSSQTWNRLPQSWFQESVGIIRRGICRKPSIRRASYEYCRQTTQTGEHQGSQDWRVDCRTDTTAKVVTVFLKTGELEVASIILSFYLLKGSACYSCFGNRRYHCCLCTQASIAIQSLDAKIIGRD